MPPKFDNSDVKISTIDASLTSREDQSAQDDDRIETFYAAIGYERLAEILQRAHDQAAYGKAGRDRHANARPFDDQPIMTIGRMVGVGGHAYQICKKAQEATGMVRRDQLDAARAEFLGVINYAAAAILLLDEIDAEHHLVTADVSPVGGNDRAPNPMRETTSHV